ncbi:MAG: transposase [Chitinophagales bacterium]
MKQQTKVKLEIRQRRVFSEAFKKSRVKELVEKRITVKQIQRMYEVSSTSVYKWLYQYSPHHDQKTTLVVQMESEAERNKYLLQQVADLERVVGRKQMEIDFLNKMFEIGSEELGFDLKKNFSTRLSNGFGTGENKTTGTP